MAKSLNKVMLIGNLGKDPEVRFTPSGVAIATFTLATNEAWKDQEGNLQERTEWHNIVAWRKLAEICGEYLKKGKKVYIEGRIQSRSYDDKNTGQKRTFTEIVADNVIMLDSRGAGEGGGSERPSFGGGQSYPSGGGSSRGGHATPGGDGGEMGGAGKEPGGPDEDLPF